METSKNHLKAFNFCLELILDHPVYRTFYDYIGFKFSISDYHEKVSSTIFTTSCLPKLYSSPRDYWYIE